MLVAMTLVLTWMFFLYGGCLDTVAKRLILVVNVVSVGFTLVLRSGVGCVFAYANILLSCLLFNNIALPSKINKTMRLLLVALMTLYLLCGRVEKKYETWFFYDVNGEYINANTIGIIILSVALNFICYVSATDIRCDAKVFVSVLTFAAAFFSINIFECRSALIALILFAVLACFVKNPFTFKTYRGLTVAILTVSLVFPVFYVFSYEYLADITIMGKPLFTGRQLVWESAFELISQAPILGSGTEMSFEGVAGGTESGHNMLLSLWKTTGIVPVITLFFVMVNHTKEMKNASRNRLIQFAFLATLVVCFFESFYTDARLQMLFLPFLLSHMPSQEVGEEKRHDSKKNSLLLVRR
ncbi:MAG: O-antigen ligase family protein [Clostridia bacterium]|nr:O-antigen ligase family protein [Clostridia bacterium]